MNYLSSSHLKAFVNKEASSALTQVDPVLVSVGVEGSASLPHVLLAVRPADPHGRCGPFVCAATAAPGADFRTEGQRLKSINFRV